MHTYDLRGWHINGNFSFVLAVHYPFHLKIDNSTFVGIDVLICPYE